MRSSTFTNFAFLATTLLLKDALAAPFDRREVVTDNVVVTEVATVVQQADGSYVTQLPAPKNPPAAPAPAPAPALAAAPPASTPDAPAVKVADKAAGPADAPAPAPAPAVQPSAPASSGGDSTPASGGSPLSAKRGLAYNDGGVGLLSSFLGSGSKATWAYNWGSKGVHVPSGLEFVPMLHDAGAEGSWAADASAGIAGGATHLQSYNEPDMSPDVGGSQIDASTCASKYSQHMMPFHGKALIGSPAVSSSGSPNQGIAYLKDFWSKCNGCKYDFVPCHWYGDKSQTQMFFDHLEQVKEAAKAEPGVAKDASGNPKIWITEFGINGASTDDIADWLTTVMPKLDGLDYVERYAYQWVADKFLVTGTSINHAGKVFAGLA